MIEQRLSALIRDALRGAAAEIGVPVEEIPDHVELTQPPQKRFGDFSSNIALIWGARLKRNPGEVAALVIRHLPPAEFVSSVEVAGIGFINFHVVHHWLYDVLRDVLVRGDLYGWGEPNEEFVQVEFVSANPTGPLHVGHARNAVIGDGLARVLAAAGYRVEREYYLNDYGRQMELFAESVEARYLEHFGQAGEIPEGGYQGEYVKDLAAEVAADLGDSMVRVPREERLERLLAEGYGRALAGIRATVERLGIVFDTWLSERSLHETGAVADALKRIRESGHTYDKDGALFFGATEFGDDKDRVLVRSNGEPTYLASDCAYLINKFARGFDHLLYVWGADHHGTVRRMVGATEALGLDPSRVEFLVMQLVMLSREGTPVRLSKRSGELITIDELLDEVGADAARFILLSRSHDSPLEFDLELAKRQELDNPVYYVQYAHARIASILRHAEGRGVEIRPLDEVDFEVLDAEAELDLLRRMAELPEEIAVAANVRGPYRLTRYAADLAALFHRFYAECRVVTDDEALTQARLWLCRGARQVIANVLGLLGVSAPDSMERIVDE